MEKIFYFFIELLGWVLIAACPTFIGAIISAIIYFNMLNMLGVVLASIILFFGLLLGIIWATLVWKREGTNHFLSRIIATPDLDKNDKS